jgi:hypothetical protein
MELKASSEAHFHDLDLAAKHTHKRPDVNEDRTLLEEQLPSHYKILGGEPR